MLKRIISTMGRSKGLLVFAAIGVLLGSSPRGRLRHGGVYLQHLVE